MTENKTTSVMITYLGLSLGDMTNALTEAVVSFQPTERKKDIRQSLPDLLSTLNFFSWLSHFIDRQKQLEDLKKCQLLLTLLKEVPDYLKAQQYLSIYLVIFPICREIHDPSISIHIEPFLQYLEHFCLQDVPKTAQEWTLMRTLQEKANFQKSLGVGNGPDPIFRK